MTVLPLGTYVVVVRWCRLARLILTRSSVHAYKVAVGGSAPLPTSSQPGKWSPLEVQLFLVCLRESSIDIQYKTWRTRVLGYCLAYTRGLASAFQFITEHFPGLPFHLLWVSFEVLKASQYLSELTGSFSVFSLLKSFLLSLLSNRSSGVGHVWFVSRDGDLSGQDLKKASFPKAVRQNI